MKKLILNKEIYHWIPERNDDLDMDLLLSLLDFDSPGFPEECLNLARDKDYDFGGGNLISLDRTENEVILSYEYETDGYKFAIKDTELEKIITEWLRLTRSGVTRITIESQDDTHFTVSGE